MALRMLVLWILVAAPTLASADRVELQNDSWTPGSPVTHQAGFLTGESAGVRFDASSSPGPYSLESVRLLFGGEGFGTRTMTLRVFEDDGTTTPADELYVDEISVSPADDELQTIDVMDIDVPGRFWVTLEFQHSGTPSIAADDDGIESGINFIGTDGWIPAEARGVYGDFIVRAVVDVSGDDAGVDAGVGDAGPADASVDAEVPDAETPDAEIRDVGPESSVGADVITTTGGDDCDCRVTPSSNPPWGGMFVFSAFLALAWRRR